MFMSVHKLATAMALSGALALVGCHSSDDEPMVEQTAFDARISVHREGDDLLTAGLGLSGLMAPPPALSESAAPEPEALRRLAIHQAWNALAALTPAGGVGGLMDELSLVPGREYSTFARLADATHPVRYLVQVPDQFDLDRPCLVVAPASGSRGVYGAIVLAGPWALARGCAVAYTDKGAGTDFFDYSDRSGVALSGQRVPAGSEALGFEPAAHAEADDPALVGMPHAHSGDHPESAWGEHTLQAVRFGLEVLNHAFERAFDADNTRIIATGLSNGGGAVLRAAEQDRDGLIDAVVAVMPNITAPGIRPLYDFATQAALFQPCMLADLETTMAMPLGNPLLAAAGQQRCAALVAHGLLEQADPQQARETLLAMGVDEWALELATANVALDLWRSVAVGYASAYLRRGPSDMPCGFRMIASVATAQQRHGWWASHSGIGASGGIEQVDSLASGRDAAMPGLICLRELWQGESEEASELRRAIEQVRASARLPAIPVLVIHGREDALIPAALSSRPYVHQARAAGASISYWEVARAQHFDVLLNAPGVGERLVPILPFGWAGLEHIDKVLDGQAELGDDRHIDAIPAPAGQALQWQQLGIQWEL
jgi:hydroxybutyrate-dimer hydrolase